MLYAVARNPAPRRISWLTSLGAALQHGVLVEVASDPPPEPVGAHSAKTRNTMWRVWWVGDGGRLLPRVVMRSPR